MLFMPLHCISLRGKFCGFLPSLFPLVLCFSWDLILQADWELTMQPQLT